MATFPPRAWTVRFLQDMENIDCGLIDGNNLTMEALVAVRPAGGEEGNFRFALAGPDMLKLVEDLVFSQDAVITDGKGQDMGDKFLAAIGHNKALAAQETNRPGLCMGWVLGTREGSKDVILLAQVKIN